MKLSTKVFLSFFAILTISVGLLGFVFYTYERDRLLSEYDSRHHLLINIISASLKRYEIAAEAKAKNALLYLSTYEKTHGMPPNKELKALAAELSITNFYVTDKNGFFIRNTEEEQVSVPAGLFSFCPGYRNLTYGDTKLEKTPILPSYPYYLPFKFFMMPNHNRTKVLEAGMHFDDFASVLGSAIESSEDLLAISLFTPNGDVLGHYTKGIGVRASTIDNKDAAKEKISVPPPAKISDAQTITHTSKIYADIQNCCECKVKKLFSKDDEGKYYYYLKTTASKASFNRALKQIRTNVLLITMILLLLAYVIANWIVKAHLLSFQTIISYVSRLNIKSLTPERLDLKKSDLETQQLSSAINSLVDELAESKRAIERASAAEAYYKLSRQIAHDIRSPLMALKVLEESLTEIADDKRALLVRILSRITEILSGLRKTSLGSSSTGNDLNKRQRIHIVPFLTLLVNEKSLLVPADKKIGVKFAPNSESLDIFSDIEPMDFSRALSNLIDNAIESISREGNVQVKLKKEERDSFSISIIDDGKGMHTNIVAALGQEGFSHGKQGSGLGFAQAKKCVEAAGGNVQIQSTVGAGSTITITLPRSLPPAWYINKVPLKGKRVALIDDDRNALAMWQVNPGVAEVKFEFFASIQEFLASDFSRAPSESSVVICDYNFGTLGNSYDFIREHYGKLNIVLSTNMFDDKSVTGLCESYNIPMVPKPIVPYIDIA